MEIVAEPSPTGITDPPPVTVTVTVSDVNDHLPDAVNEQ